MRSQAHIKSHPIHPALIPFPFAFLTGAVLFDITGVTLGRPPFWTTGGHLIVGGIAAGLLAAIPGVIDYMYSVPPGSSGQARARRHGIGNVTALLLFAAAWFMRLDTGEPGAASLALEIPAAALLAYSASLGGTLVTRNMISVDHRYAQAGKWQEATFTSPATGPLRVAREDALKTDQMMLLRVNGKRIVLARTAAGYTAFDDSCSHRGGSLAGGVLIDQTVQCLWHGSQFDTASGRVVCGPAEKAISVYPTSVVDGHVVLDSPPRAN